MYTHVYMYVYVYIYIYAAGRSRRRCRSDSLQCVVLTYSFNDEKLALNTTIKQLTKSKQGAGGDAEAANRAGPRAAASETC